MAGNTATPTKSQYWAEQAERMIEDKNLNAGAAAFLALYYRTLEDAEEAKHFSESHPAEPFPQLPLNEKASEEFGYRTAIEIAAQERGRQRAIKEGKVPDPMNESRSVAQDLPGHDETPDPPEPDIEDELEEEATNHANETGHGVDNGS